MERLMVLSYKDNIAAFPFIPTVTKMYKELALMDVNIYHERLELSVNYQVELEHLLNAGNLSLIYPWGETTIFPSPLFGEMLMTSYLLDEQVLEGGIWYYLMASVSLLSMSSIEEGNAIRLALLHDMGYLYPSTAEWIAYIEATLLKGKLLKNRPSINKLKLRL